MTQTVSISELAEALGISKKAVSKRFAHLPSTTEAVRGGQRKGYALHHLPEEIRLLLVTEEIGTRENGRWESTQSAISIKANQALSAEKERISAEQQLANFAAMPAEKQTIAYVRRDILQMRDEWLQITGETVKNGTIKFAQMYNDRLLQVDKHITTIVPQLSWATINRWNNGYKKSGLTGLVPGWKNPKKQTTMLTLEQQNFVLALIYTRPHIRYQGIKMALTARFRLAGQEISESVISRFVKRWKEEHASLYLYITNPDKWRNKHQFALGSASESTVRLNQLWEFDSTPADLLLTDGRYNLIGVIDVYSRRLKLHVSKTSKATAVASLFRKALLDWGVPEIAKTDNGSDYVSHHIVSVIDALKIDQQLCPPFTPECKPHIERVFKSFAHSFQELMPGYIGHSVADRKDVDARNSFASRIMGQADVPINMTAKELQRYCDRWVEAIYHQKGHRSLAGKTPQQMADAWQEAILRINDERALDILLAEAPSNKGVRTVEKNGVKVGGLTYIADDLPRCGRKVRVKLDITDLGTIYLFDQESGDFLCVAKEANYTGIDRAKTGMKIKNRQKKLLQEQSKELRKMVKRQAVEEIHDEILSYAEEQSGYHFDTTPSAEYSTPALEQAAEAVKQADNIIKNEKRRSDEEAALLLTLHEAEPELPTQNQQKKRLIFSDADRYEIIMEEVNAGQAITAEDEAFLTAYYKTPNGKMLQSLATPAHPASIETNIKEVIK